MEIIDNARSWIPTPNHEGIGKGVERRFLDENKRIMRVVTWDRN